LTDADIFVLPSYNENFGIAVAEALAAGTPVIISDQVGLHEEVSAARVGSVTTCRVPDLAMELDRWLGDRALRDDTAQRARRWAFSRFDWHAIALRWVEHYEELIGSLEPGYADRYIASSSPREHA
jgi:glycosyltransferase involved in cell wall biosynthesis